MPTQEPTQEPMLEPMQEPMQEPEHEPAHDDAQIRTQPEAPATQATQATHRGRIVYIVGPSGAGKDSLISYARARIGPQSNVRFARRTITRPANAAGENHVPVTLPQFEALLAQGAFAMHWRANGHCYGIGDEIRAWLEQGATVVISGSREYLPQALAAFPAILVVHVTAAAPVRRERLLARGRDTATAVEARLARAATISLPSSIAATGIVNDGPLETAGRALLECLVSRAL